MTSAGCSARSRLAVRAYRVLLEQRSGQGRPRVGAWPVERLVRLSGKLDTVVAAMTPAERAYYAYHVGTFGDRGR